MPAMNYQQGAEIYDICANADFDIEIFDPATMLVGGQQLYEDYDAAGRLRATRVVDICFYVHTPTSFERLGYQAGFRVETLYGDHTRADFEPERSPVMIWTLHK